MNQQIGNMPKLVLIVGAERSGTTWLQLLLGSHQDVVTTQETHVFPRYLSRMHNIWDYENKNQDNRKIGITRIISENDFINWCKVFSDQVFLKAIEKENEINPTYFLEKTPLNALHLPLINKLYPNVLVIHLVRDPRSVVSSLLAANKGWGKTWAPGSAITAARLWLDANNKAVDYGKVNKKYLLIKYEDLKSSTEKELKKVFYFLSLEHDENLVHDIVQKNDINQLKSGSESSKKLNDQSEPDGFYRKGELESWRNDLSNSQIAITESICGSLMKEFGYQEVKKPGFFLLPLMIRTILDSLAWRTESFFKYLKDKF